MSHRGRIFHPPPPPLSQDLALPNQLAKLGEQCHQEGDVEKAMDYYRRALTLQRNHAGAIYGLGMAAWQVGQLDLAVKMLKLVCAQAPNHPEAHYNLGSMLQNTHDHIGAMAARARAIELKPDFADAWGNLGCSCRDLGDHEMALTCFEKAVAFARAGTRVSAEARYNLCYPLLSMGRLKEGFAAYEARFEAPIFRGTFTMKHEQPAWTGEPLEGRRLLVHAEQGFGDSIMFARYLPMLAERGAGPVVVEVQPPLQRLFAGNFPQCTVIAQGDAVPEVDLQVPLMSLAHRFGTELDTIPVPIPYLGPPPEPTLPAGDGLRVGFCWRGNASHRNDRNRSTSLRAWRSLATIPGTSWYSLQVEEECLAFSCRNLRRLMRDFADTASLIAQLHLVVTVDTAIAHLAGAMGRACFVLLPAVPDWRWQLKRPDSPWYPSLRLFHQPHAGDWPTAFQQVDATIRAIVERRLTDQADQLKTGAKP